MAKDEIEAAKPIVAMICATIITTIALYLGINGLVLAGGLGVVSGLGGYTLKSKLG